MKFLLTFTLAALGFGVAVSVLRAAAAGGNVAWPRLTAVFVVALLVSTGLVSAGDGYRKMREKREKWAPMREQDAVEAPGLGVDPPFVRFAKPHLLRGDTFFVSRNASAGERLWLNYRFAPNLAEDKLADADWLVYWREPDPFKTHRVRLEDVVTHLKWGPDVGLIRIRRAS